MIRRASVTAGGDKLYTRSWGAATCSFWTALNLFRIFTMANCAFQEDQADSEVLAHCYRRNKLIKNTLVATMTISGPVSR